MMKTGSAPGKKDQELDNKFLQLPPSEITN